MNEDLRNEIRREAGRVLGTLSLLRMGLVSSYDPQRYAARVRLQPDDVETGWLPIAVPVVGNGFGLFAPPAVGDQVVVGFQEGSVEAGVVLGALYSDDDRPVVQGIGGCPSGEVRLVNRTGARVRILGDGTVEIRVKAGTQARLNPDGSVDIHGTELRVGAEGGAFQRLVDERFVALFNQHVHGNSPPPTPQMSVGAHTTTQLKAT